MRVFSFETRFIGGGLLKPKVVFQNDVVVTGHHILFLLKRWEIEVLIPSIQHIRYEISSPGHLSREPPCSGAPPSRDLSCVCTRFLRFNVRSRPLKMRRGCLLHAPLSSNTVLAVLSAARHSNARLILRTRHVQRWIRREEVRRSNMHLMNLDRPGSSSVT